MFHLLGKLVSRSWPIWLVAWLVVLVLSWLAAPNWNAVTESGEVASLPENSPSRLGETFFRDAFPEQYAASSIVLVASRQEQELQDQDKKFVEKVLVSRLKDLRTKVPKGQSIVAHIRSRAEEGADVLLDSQDGRATLVVVQLTTSFLDRRNDPIVGAVEELVDRLHQEKAVPEGLTVNVTGIATGGRDLIEAEMQSIRAIERWTIVIVVILLLILYRAPLTALIPLATVFVAVQTALNLLAIMAGSGILLLDRETRIFITVLAYGAGVDYCVFLIARYREELDNGLSPADAVAAAIGHVGAAIAASAGTVICGIATLAFARFGKVHQAGIVIPFALALVLLAALTFSPALLRLAGRWAFWPQPIATTLGQSGPRALNRLLYRHMLPNIWEKLGPVLLRRPGTIWLVSTLALAPFVVVAFLHYHDQVYNPMSGMPQNSTSVRASHALEQHFPPGIVDQIVAVAKNPGTDFSEEKNIEAIARQANRLLERKRDLGLADVYSVGTPLGTSPTAKETLGYLPATPQLFPESARKQAVQHYVSHEGKWTGHATHMNMVLMSDPFSRSAIADLNKIDSALHPEVADSQVAYAGATASARDLQTVKQGDQRRAEILVPIVVFLLLMLVLRRVVISIYLVLSVLFSYLATLGVTLLVFGLSHWGAYEALDWKVPIFLFAILVAVGEDYNIFLMMRIKEEIGPHGPLNGITEGLYRTGRVISSCGFIMAGTFATLLSGSLLAMQELGFALAFGILLDTLVVRPIMVPSFLILLRSGRLGPFAQRYALEPEKPVQAKAA
jgi:RND superfamily putative drug exporter